MGSLSDYGENAFINHLCGSPFTPPANIYLALCTADPTDAATGASMNEIANSGAYARTAIVFAAAGSRAIVQNANCQFPQATSSWGTATHWTLCDSNTYGAGNVLAHGAFTTSYPIVTGNRPTIASGQVDVAIQASDGEGFTTQLCNWMLDLMFRNQAYSQPATYCALLTTAGADTDTTLTTKEVTGTDYDRVLLNKAGGSTPRWDTVAGGATENENQVLFPTVGSGGWDEIVGMAIVDVSSNVLFYDNDQVEDQTPNEGDTVDFVAGDLDVSMT